MFHFSCSAALQSGISRPQGHVTFPRLQSQNGSLPARRFMGTSGTCISGGMVREYGPAKNGGVLRDAKGENHEKRKASVVRGRLRPGGADSCPRTGEVSGVAVCHVVRFGEGRSSKSQ